MALIKIGAGFLPFLVAAQLWAQEKIEIAPPDKEPPASEEKSKPNELRVSPTGRRDPFRPFTLNQKNTQRRRENLAPLERFELGQLKLVGIVWNRREPTAMVEDSAGLGYVVRVGTAIGVNEGKVKTIRENEIIIEEIFVDLYGAKKRREVAMKLSVETAE